MFRKAFLDLEKETLKNNSSGITGTRRILPKEVYELEGEDEKEDKPKGWLSWFQGIYRRDVQEDDLTPEPSIIAPESNPQSASSGQNVPTLNDSKPTSILSKILPTAHKKDFADNTQQMKGKPKKLTTENNSSRD